MNTTDLFVLAAKSLTGKIGTLEIVIGIVVVLLIVGALLFVYLENKKNLKEWKEKAEKLGFEFDLSVDRFHQAYGDFILVEEGDRNTVSLAMYGEKNGVHICIADYHYPVEYSKGMAERETWQSKTICAVTSDRINVPHTFLFPQGALVGWVSEYSTEYFGHADIKIEADEAFSKAFVFQGSNIDDARELFTPELRKWFVAKMNDGVTLFEGQGDTLIFAINNRTPSANQAVKYLKQGFSLMKAFQTKAGIQMQ